MKSTFVVPVEFGDTDPATIVFYPHFFRWFDASAWRLFAKVGLTLDVLQNEFGLVGLPIAEAQSKFIKPARLGDSLEITSYATNWRRKTFDVVHQVVNSGELCAEGIETRVCARRREEDSREFVAISIPKEIRQRFPDPDT
jgi:4-hydroxybenzoyl-CoA thioesterase